MDRFWHLVKSLLFPKWWIVLLSVPIAVAGLVYAFTFNHPSDWSAYVCYILSAVSFTWICARIIRSSGYWKQNANAIRGVIKYRKYRSPVMSSVRVLQFAAALVSMLALETAMLTQFGGENSLAFRHIMTGCTGSGVCTMILCIAIYMLCRAAKEIKALELEGKST